MELYTYYRQALETRPKPLAFLDLERFERNAQAVLARAGSRVRVRVASKSLRCRTALRRILASDARFSGVLTYSARETVWLSQCGFDDLLLAYPVVNTTEISRLCVEAAAGKTITCMVDASEHVARLEQGAAALGVTLPVCLDLDLSSDFPGLHFGVYRSSLDGPRSAVQLADQIAASRHLRLSGLMGYEAQIAGVPDRSLGQVAKSGLIRWLKRRSLAELRERRESVCRSLEQAGHRLDFVNGGGTGSLETTCQEACVTEVSAGSAFFSPHLFDGYQQFRHEPAAGFALEVCRTPKPGIVTCLGGGYVASGATGAEKQPLPYLPSGVRLLALEGAGEVQTPLHYAGSPALRLGDPVFFRHAKAGELCEHFNQLHVVSSGKIIEEWATYRGEGQCS